MSRGARRAAATGLPIARDLRLDILPVAQRRLWNDLEAIPPDFVLYGGTAIALRLGHRQSTDFDFFSATPFAHGELLAAVSFLGRVEVIDAGPNVLTLRTASRVKVSFFGGMNLQVVAEPSIAVDNGIAIASLDDLAGTKAKALVDRAEWRDYVDIDALLRAGISLSDVIGCATTIFAPNFVFPGPLFLRGLVSFSDGTAPEVEPAVRVRLEAAVAAAWRAEVPTIAVYAQRISA